MFDFITLETDDRGVAYLTLNRPDKHNAMGAQMIAEITAACGEISADPAIRVVVLAANGKSFCAGGDLDWMRAQMEMPPATRADEAMKLARMLQAIDQLPQPVIGRLQGNALGGGVGMASVCDIAIGTDAVKMGLTETRLGLIPATIGPYVIARMGAANARRVFMSARIFDAVEAQSLGLLARVVAPNDLDAAIEAEITPYLSCAPGAVASAKALIHQLAAPVSEDMLAQTAAALVARWESPKSAEGIAAFFEKRKATWML